MPLRSLLNGLYARVSGNSPARYAHLGRFDLDVQSTQAFWHSRPLQRIALVLTLVATCLGILNFSSNTYGSSTKVLGSYKEAPPTAMFADHSLATRHLIIASYKSQNITWLSQVPSTWKVYRYVMDDPNPEPPNLSVPRNQGREAMAYLTYMIDNYGYLPDYMIFTHGHERSWHQVEPLQMKIRALNLTALDRENYISLRCGDQMGCERQPYIDTKYPNWGGEYHMCDFWKTVMPHEPCPRYVSYKCCAQHAVTRNAVHRRSLQDWIRIREPLMRDFNDQKNLGPGVDDYIGGIFYEKFWHKFFGAGDEYCPSVETCQQVHFSNAIICDSDIDLTLFELDVWKDTVCVSAFDEIDKDAPDEPAIQTFHREILAKYREIREKAAARHKSQQDALVAAEGKSLKEQETTKSESAKDLGDG